MAMSVPAAGAVLTLFVFMDFYSEKFQPWPHLLQHCSHLVNGGSCHLVPQNLHAAGDDLAGSRRVETQETRDYPMLLSQMMLRLSFRAGRVAK